MDSTLVFPLAGFACLAVALALALRLGLRLHRLSAAGELSRSDRLAGHLSSLMLGVAAAAFAGFFGGVLLVSSSSSPFESSKSPDAAHRQRITQLERIANDLRHELETKPLQPSDRLPPTLRRLIPEERRRHPRIRQVREHLVELESLTLGDVHAPSRELELPEGSWRPGVATIELRTKTSQLALRVDESPSVRTDDPPASPRFRIVQWTSIQSKPSEPASSRPEEISLSWARLAYAGFAGFLAFVAGMLARTIQRGLATAKPPLAGSRLWSLLFVVSSLWLMTVGLALGAATLIVAGCNPS